jgi:F-type H+-transporting ATPase subunit c
MKVMHLACLVFLVVLIGAVPVFAADNAVGTETPTGKASTIPQVSVFSGAAIAAGLGMGLTIIGAGYGLGRIGSGAMEGMARQPEIAARIQTAMLIIAAMLEGATLASVVLCYLVGQTASF